VIYGNAGCGVRLGMHQPARLLFNTICGNAKGADAAGIHDSLGLSNLYRGNIVVRNGRGIVGRGRATFNDVWGNGINMEGLTHGRGWLEADPKFIAPDRGDFRLAPDSPCRDPWRNGVALGAE
jgi:hypothetical protein